MDSNIGCWDLLLEQSCLLGLRSELVWLGRYTVPLRFWCYAGHPHQVVGGCRQLGPELVSRCAQVAQLPPPAHRFAPAEDLLHTFAHPLTEAVAWVSGHAPINGASSPLSLWV